ncbi:MAG TPA: VOC family protein [Nocardioides sp.]|uniref:VOC family protein n=1 Tax=uncultured Nocardioides sp. TaxID=198441 RepID=UPI00260D8BE5|nr:VOC family protein [uncultured Nocardioides sp.]HRD63385.1 VOC family protein [Nocardioides sp.]HRI98009.1 VOC family protein [Nocardioides sp.]HRK47674.1 VOC family protein [Nocardioides sp.]
MSSFISHTTIDCTNAYELSEWWKPVLGYVDLDGDPNLPGHEECMIRDPETGHQVLFIEVPEPVRGKNWHFDVRPRERSRDDEVAWLQEYGATEVADHRGIYGPGSGWVTLADPEGNQFCVLRSPAELEAQQPHDG